MLLVHAHVPLKLHGTSQHSSAHAFSREVKSHCCRRADGWPHQPTPTPTGCAATQHGQQRPPEPQTERQPANTPRCNTQKTIATCARAQKESVVALQLYTCARIEQQSLAGAAMQVPASNSIPRFVQTMEAQRVCTHACMYAAAELGRRERFMLCAHAHALCLDAHDYHAHVMLVCHALGHCRHYRWQCLRGVHSPCATTAQHPHVRVRPAASQPAPPRVSVPAETAAACAGACGR
jgi:hypothetical protein